LRNKRRVKDTTKTKTIQSRYEIDKSDLQNDMTRNQKRTSNAKQICQETLCFAPALRRHIILKK
jgi:hypothetical protein